MCVKVYNYVNNTSSVLLCYDENCAEFKKNYLDKYGIEREPIQKDPIDVFVDGDKICVFNKETKEYHICNKIDVVTLS